MKDLSDFVAIGEKFGLKKTELSDYAQSEFEKYVIQYENDRKEAKLLREAEQARIEQQARLEQDKLEQQAKLDQDRYEREMRLLERKAQLAENERSTVDDTSGNTRTPHMPTFKFTSFNEKNDDLDTWFSLFERQCISYGVKDKDRKAHLLSLFSGQCREAFLTIDPEATYSTVRSVLLQRFNLTKHDYRKKFFDISPNREETITSYCQRLTITFDKWIDLSKIDKTFESLRDLIVSHRVVQSCNPKLVSFLLERDSSQLNELEANANLFFQAHVNESLGKGSDLPFSANSASTFNDRGRNQQRHGYYGQGHRERYRSTGPHNKQHKKPTNWRVGNRDYNMEGNIGSNLNNNEKVLTTKGESTSGDVRSTTRFGNADVPNVINNHRQCWICKGWGHTSIKCSSRKASNCSMVEDWRTSSSFSVSRTVSNDKRGDITCFSLPESLCIKACNNAKSMKEQHVYEGLLTVENTLCPVRVLRDTGSMIHAVHKTLVKPENYNGKTLSLITFGGKKEEFKMADIYVDTPFIKGTVAACVLENYPENFRYYDVLIGNGDTLGSPKALDPTPEVVTKWESSHKTRHTCSSSNINHAASAITITTDDDDNESNDLVGLTSNQVQTRAQRHQETKTRGEFNDQVLNFDISYSELASLQKNDDSLTKYFSLVDCKPKNTKSGICSFEIRNGILVRLFKSDRYSFVQVMLPKQLRSKILSLGHDMPFSAHMGINRTLVRVTSSFYWPGVTADIKKFCRTCSICLKTSSRGRTPRAPLQNGTPVIGKPFHKWGIDLIGPLPVSDNKNQYVLTMIDYATRWVEAVPLKDITAGAVAEEMIKIFSRVGIPSIVLSDGGPQFVADLMEKVLKLLGIRHSVSSPYHPQSNGLCEKANDTIKSLIKKVAHFNPGSWDRYLPCVLFAYRETPQETTGYAPFELVYGSLPRGPMSLVKDLWLQPDLGGETVSAYQYVIDLRQRIASACKIAKQKTEVKHDKSKKRYDLRAKHRSLSIGDQVLLFLPCGSNKINSEWKGPFRVVDTVPDSKVNYVVDINGRCKTYHINMLKEYCIRPQYLVPDIETVQKGNVAKVDVDTLLTCSNVSMIDENQDENVDLLGSESFANIVLPSLEQTETIKDVNINVHLTNTQKCEAKNLLQKFDDVFSDVPAMTNCIEHDIELNSHVPIKLKPYPLPFASEKIVKDEVENMLKSGVIEPSNSPYSSPIVLVKKKDGKTRFCIDFRKINSITVSDASPIPDQDQLFAKLSSAKYFTKIDVTKAYWQVGIVKGCRKYTAFQAGSCLYQFTRMAFGLKNAPATFNRLMAKLLGHRHDTVFFFDDVLIFTDMWEEHVQAVSEILTIFRDSNLKIRPKKTDLGSFSVVFLGHEVGKGLLKPMSENITKIINIKVPKTKKQVRGIVGLVNYYAKFIPNISTILIPLYKLTEKGMPEKVSWTDECQSAIAHIQTRLNASPLLILPDLSKLFFVQTDASGLGIGASLLQYRENHLRPCLFLSRKLEDRETRYSVIERECLSIIWALQKLSRYLLGRRFVIQTDHRPLRYINDGKLLNARICRWALILQQFDFQIEFISGQTNVLADFLSRNL